MVPEQKLIERGDTPCAIDFLMGGKLQRQRPFCNCILLLIRMEVMLQVANEQHT